MQVLTSGMWPQTTAVAPTCNLPRELEQCTADFVQYYLKANSGAGRGAVKGRVFAAARRAGWGLCEGCGVCALPSCSPTVPTRAPAPPQAAA